MKTLLLFIFLSLTLPSASRAESCAPPLTRSWKNLSLTDLEKKWKKAAAEPCESYALAYALFLRSPEEKIGVQWLRKSISTLQNAGDHDRILQQLMSSMAQWPHLSGELDLRLSLLDSVSKVALAQGRKGDLSWADYFLGIQVSPFAEILPSQFAEDFPSHPDALAKVKALEAKLADFYLQKELTVAQAYRQKSEFLAALFRLEFLLKQTFVLSRREPLVLVLRKIVAVEFEFACYLQDPPSWGNVWPDSRVRAIPGIPSPYSRESTARYFLSKAKQTKPENLLKNLP